MHMALFFHLILLVMTASCAVAELVELACSNDAHCAHLERSKCENSNCICMANGTEQKEDCHLKEESQKITNIIGGPCPCIQPHTKCIERLQKQQCYCSTGYIPSVDRRRCLPEMVELDGKCELDSQCQRSDTFSVCHPMHGRCLCKTSFENHSGRCLGVLESNCKNDTDCESFDAFVCLPNLQKCGCSTNHVPSRNMTKCIVGASYGEFCGHNLTCQLLLGAAGQCREEDYRCACRLMHYPKEIHENGNKSVICQPIVPYGAYCLNDSDCQMDSLEHIQKYDPMQCLYGDCQCRPGSTLENDKCIAKSGAGILQISTICLISITLHRIFIGIYI